jgi:uncharacterized membrane protein YfcA
MPWHHHALLFLIAAIAGAINSVAGGGTLLTFPSLLWAGLAPTRANCTSTVALWPGQLGSLWGYRGEIGRSGKIIAVLAVPSLIGGAIGAYLLTRTSDKAFSFLVPYLILAATCLFMAQEPISRWLRRRAERARTESGDAEDGSASEDEHLWRPWRWAVVVFFQFLVAIYGGYFGAGIGILMLAALGFLGFTNIHRMNGLKNINGMCINAVAAGMFIYEGLVEWQPAILMAIGSILGGYLGAGAAQRIGQKNVRRLVILIGLALSVSLFLR